MIITLQTDDNELMTEKIMKYLNKNIILAFSFISKGYYYVLIVHLTCIYTVLWYIIFVLSEKIFETVVDPEEYLQHLVDQAPFVIIGTAYILPGGGEPEQSVEIDETGRFRRPDIDVEVTNH